MCQKKDVFFELRKFTVEIGKYTSCIPSQCVILKMCSIVWLFEEEKLVYINFTLKNVYNINLWNVKLENLIYNIFYSRKSYLQSTFIYTQTYSENANIR